MLYSSVDFPDLPARCRAEAAKADLMGADQQAKNNLLALTQSGLDLTTAQQNAASGTKREASDGAHIPSPGTAENMFADSEHPENDREEAVNE